MSIRPEPAPTAARPARSSSRLDEVLQAGLRKLSLEQGETAVFAETPAEKQMAIYIKEYNGLMYAVDGGVVQNMRDEAVHAMGFTNMLSESSELKDRPAAPLAGFLNQPGYFLIPGKAYEIPASPLRTHSIFAEEHGGAKSGYAIGFLDDKVEYDAKNLSSIVEKMGSSRSVREFEKRAGNDTVRFPLPYIVNGSDSEDYARSVHAWANATVNYEYANDIGNSEVSAKKAYSNFWLFLRIHSLTQAGEVHLSLGRWSVTNYGSPDEPWLELEHPECGMDSKYELKDKRAQGIAYRELRLLQAKQEGLA